MSKCRQCNNELYNDSYASCKHCEREQQTLFSLGPRIREDLRHIVFPKDQTEKDLILLLKKRPTGEGLFFIGKVGSGKTRYAAHLLMKSFAFKQAFSARLFVTVPDLLQEIRLSFDSKSNISEMEIIDKYSKAELLVMDDLGVEKTTDWAFQTLYIIINHRYEELRPTIFTSNLSLLELAMKFGDERITSRINGSCEVRIFDEKDLRRM